jgi:hypothetical protein
MGFTTTYIKTGPAQQIFAGMAPSSALGKDELLIEPIHFIWAMQRLLLDPTIAISVPPTANSVTIDQTNCFSYVLPGQIFSIFTDNDGVVLSPLDYSDENRNDATAYLTVSAPAYEIEYFPIQDDIQFEDSDGQMLGYNSSQFKVCLKNIGAGLAAGNLLTYAQVVIQGFEVASF